MQKLKFVAALAAIAGISGCFMQWLRIDLGQGAALLSGIKMPVAGMDNGGPVFLFLFGVVLVCAGVGIGRRFGRGLAAGTLAGALGVTFFALVKYADIGQAGSSIRDLGQGASVSIALGYWVVLAAGVLALLVALAALIRPEQAAVG
jgi:hypothetical protein